MKRMLKAAVALLLIFVLLRGVEWPQAERLLQSVQWWALALALLFMSWELVLSALKWDWALRMHELRFGFGYLLKIQAQGYFANNFLPSAVGGDAYRAYRTMPASGFKSRAISAVLVERVSGLASLVFIGAIAALVLIDDSPVARLYLAACTIGTLAMTATVIALHLGWLKPLTNRIRHLPAFDAVAHNLSHWLRARREWVYVGALSLLFQAGSVLLLFGYFILIGDRVPLTYCALLAAVAGLAGILPISINGIGVVEGSIVGTAVALGIDYQSAVLVALLRRLMMIVLSVLCGASFLFDREVAPGATVPSR